MQDFRRTRVPPSRLTAIALGLGIDVTSSALSAKPGTARAAVNYEVNFGGGYERVRGYERFDGRPQPSAALYTTLMPVTSFTGVVVGDTLTGGTSGATGVVIYVSAAYLALTKVVGAFVDGEPVLKAGLPVGNNTASTPAIDALQDNVLYALAADAYRADIQKVPGSGPVRGIATLGNTLYAWRDNAGGTAMEIYKSTSTGWQIVPRYYEYRFSSGTSAYADGGTLTQGAVSATIKRVVLESGTWGSSAAGRLICALPTGGNFANGAAAGSGACTLASVPATSALAQISYLPGGRVETDNWNFYGSAGTQRIYGCDGVNREFEFDGDVWVPLNTGMTPRASFVRAHKNYLFYAFKGSLQKSAVGEPYKWSAVLGAAEIGIGDDTTGLATFPGDNTSSALAVFGKDSMYVLYGSTTDTFSLVPLSREAGANPYSVQSLSVPICHDPQGFRAIRLTQNFANYEWDLASKLIDKLARNRTPVCSVFSSRYSRYRCFFADGGGISGTPVGKGIAWTQLDLGFAPSVAYSNELGGKPRTFYGSPDGYVYEADVGRSFDGQPIQAAIRLTTITLGSPMFNKRWRYMDIEADAESAFTMYASAEFDDGDPNNGSIAPQPVGLAGVGGLWDDGLWDQARWDAVGLQRKVIEIPGVGYGVSPIFYSYSATELSHTVRSVVPTYTPMVMRKP